MRRLYLARHGDADAFGTLTDAGRRQAALLGERLRVAPVDVVWHSPLPRAVETARIVAGLLPGVPVIEAPELADHVPYVPGPGEVSASAAGYFDGYDDAEAAHGHELAAALVRRFGSAPAGGSRTETHEVVITHAYQIAWLVRQALDAPPAAWMRTVGANAALTVIEHRTAEPAVVVMLNDQAHLPQELRWTGFPGGGWP